MKITQEEVADRQTVLHIELEDEDLDPYLDRGYRRVSQRVAIPGFRKGKAPRRIVQQFLGREALLNEVLDSMITDVTGRAIDEQSLEAAGMPQIELLELEPFTLKATVPLRPEVDLGPYRDIRIKEESAEVTEEDIQQRLEQIQHSMASWEPVERPVKMGDMVTMNATGTVDDETVLDEQDAVYFLDEDAERPFPGFSGKLEGMELDKPGEFDLAVPEDFSDAEIAGKEIHFQVTITDIKERILPELDDEFAKGVGDGYESFEALRQSIEEELTEETESAARQRLRDQAVEAFLDGVTVEMSPVMVDHEVDHMEDDQAQFLGRFNVRLDDYLRSQGKSRDDMRGELKEEAEKRIKRTFALSRLAEVEGIDVSEEEVEDRIQSLFARDEKNEGDEEEQPEQPEITDELRESVERMLLSEKTIERLAAIARGEAPPLPESREGPAEAEEETAEAPEEVKE